MSTTSDNSIDMANAIEQLEVKVAFQEHTIETLNEEVTQQNKKIEQLSYHLNQLAERVKGLQPSDILKPSEEPPPPHY